MRGGAGAGGAVGVALAVSEGRWKYFSTSSRGGKPDVPTDAGAAAALSWGVLGLGGGGTTSFTPIYSESLMGFSFFTI